MHIDSLSQWQCTPALSPKERTPRTFIAPCALEPVSVRSARRPGMQRVRMQSANWGAFRHEQAVGAAATGDRSRSKGGFMGREKLPQFLENAHDSAGFPSAAIASSLYWGRGLGQGGPPLQPTTDSRRGYETHWRKHLTGHHELFQSLLTSAATFLTSCQRGIASSLSAACHPPPDALIRTTAVTNFRPGGWVTAMHRGDRSASGFPARLSLCAMRVAAA